MDLKNKDILNPNGESSFVGTAIVIIVICLLIMVAAQLGLLGMLKSEHYAQYIGQNVSGSVQSILGGPTLRSASEFTGTNQGGNPMTGATYKQDETNAQLLTQQNMPVPVAGSGKEGFYEAPSSWPGLIVSDYSLYGGMDQQNKTYMGYTGQGPIPGTGYDIGQMSSITEQQLMNIMQGGNGSI